MIQNGASPRATLALNLAARGNALLHGRAYATPQDVKEVVHDVLRHRILLTYEVNRGDRTQRLSICRGGGGESLRMEIRFHTLGKSKTNV